MQNNTLLNILLTNDDGIAAPGLWVAAHELARIGRVWVAAPAVNYSGYGAALPPARQIRYSPYQREDDHPSRVTAFSIDAPPAACVQVGLSGALAPATIDLVVSGVNDAANLGRDLLYSGTVGAAMTAVVMGIPAIAFSLDGNPSDPMHWDAAAWAVKVVARYRTHPEPEPEPEPALLNVNVPNRPLDELAGVMMTSLSHRSCLEKYAFTVGESLDPVLVSSPRAAPAPPAPALFTDAWAIAQGYISVTPVRLFPDTSHAIPLASTQEPVPAFPLFVSAWAA